MNAGLFQIKILGLKDCAVAARTAARAFDSDPGTRYILPDPRDRAAHLPLLMEANLRADVAAGAELVGVGAEDGLAALSVWYPPGCAAPTLWQWLLNAGKALTLLPRSAAPYRGLRLISAIERARPSNPRYGYLKMLAVSPQAQGQGLGGALLQRVADDARGRGTSVYLETFKPENVEYYRGRGFRLLFEARPAGLPPFWSMLAGTPSISQHQQRP